MNRWLVYESLLDDIVVFAGKAFVDIPKGDYYPCCALYMGGSVTFNFGESSAVCAVVEAAVACRGSSRRRAQIP